MKAVITIALRFFDDRACPDRLASEGRTVLEIPGSRLRLAWGDFG
jgi:hypothetical protein